MDVILCLYQDGREHVATNELATEVQQNARTAGGRTCGCQENRSIEENRDERCGLHGPLDEAFVADQVGNQRLLLCAEHVIAEEAGHFFVGVGAQLDIWLDSRPPDELGKAGLGDAVSTPDAGSDEPAVADITVNRLATDLQIIGHLLRRQLQMPPAAKYMVRRLRW